MFKNESNLDSRLPFIIMMSYLKNNANGITSFNIYYKRNANGITSFNTYYKRNANGITGFII